MLKITLPNGISVEGDVDSVRETIEKLGFSNMVGDETHYFSQTKGWILIKDMNTTHLRNAILKYYETWVNKLHEVRNPKLLVAKMQDGISDKTWLSMLKEYYRRGIPISQIFGQTEASTITFLSTEDAVLKIGSVGLPVFHGEVKIVDKAGKEVSAGEVGEIIINGPTLMSGYWNRPDLTAETIRSGWLYTGDLARTDEEGYVYIVDRERDLYISGGENVYPAEIEKVLHTHPKIFDVGIIGVSDERWGEVGKAFIVLKPGETMGSGEVLEFLKGKVAKYKLPKYMEFIEELPKTASGKIQKFMLKERHQIGSHKSEGRNSKQFHVTHQNSKSDVLKI